MLTYLIYIVCITIGFLIAFVYNKKKISSGISSLKEYLSKLPADHSAANSLPPELHFVSEMLKNAGQAPAKKATVQEPVLVKDDVKENLQVRNEHLHIVNELGQKLTSSLNLQESFDHLYSTVNSLMDAAVLELAVLDRESESWKVYSNIKGKDDSQVSQNHIAMWAAQNNREVFLEDCEQDFGRYVDKPLYMSDGRAAKSLMIFPIHKNGTVWGTLMVVSFNVNVYEDFHVEIIKNLLGYVSVAMQNAITHEELNQTKIRAEMSEKFKQQFLANMSHEIRTPMNAVMGMTNLILDHNPKPDQVHYLQGIKKASITLLHIINDVLDLSKIEAGKMELEEIDFSLNEVTMQVAETIQHKAEEKGIRLSTEIDESIADVVIGDPVRLNQVLMNLAGNGIKFTEKGTVTIKLSATKSTDPDKSAVKFEVIDTGIGIPADKISTIFESFRQAHASDTRKFGGTGLGLSISRQLVEMMGGEIEIESVEGEGAVFFFTVEFKKGSEERLERRITAESQVDGSTLDALNILVIDDNEYNRIVAKDTLNSKSKASVTTVESAMEGIELLQKEKFDVILMDVQMPDMDGIEATDYIRTKFNAPLKDIPIIALTASALKADVEKCMAVGMNSYLAKPFKTSDLIICIADTLKIELKTTKKDQAIKSAEEIKIVTTVTDMAYLTKFCEGDAKRMSRYIKMFVDSGPQLINTIETSLAKKDYEDVANQIHAYKTRWIMMGMEKAKDMALDIEKQIREGNFNETIAEDIGILMDQVRKGIDELSELT